MKKSRTKELLLQTGAEIILKKGFNATGIQEILKAADVPKGSFYFYFPSKEEFGLALIDYYAQEYIRKIDIKLKNKCLPPVIRLKNFFSAYAKEYEESGFTGGNLLGNLTQEMGDTHEPFRKKLRYIYSIIINKFADCLSEAQKNGLLPKSLNPKETAEFMVCAWEGTLMQVKMVKNMKPLNHFNRYMFQLLGTH